MTDNRVASDVTKSSNDASSREKNEEESGEENAQAMRQ